MQNLGLMWECECGNIDYGEYPPTECNKCEAMDSFMKVPEEQMEERKAESVLALQPEEDDEEKEEEND